MNLFEKIFDLTEQNHPEILNEMMTENRNKANMYTARVLLLMSIGLLIALLLNQFEVFTSRDPLKTPVYAVLIVLLIATAGVCYRKQGVGNMIRIIMMAVIIICSGIVTILNVYGFWACFIIAIACSCRYYERIYTVAVSSASILVAALSQCIGIMYGVMIGSADVSAFSIPSGADVVINKTLAGALIESGYISKEMLQSYALGQNINVVLVLTGAAYISYKISKHGKMAIIEAANLNAEKQESALKSEEMRTQVMISQMQPHFLYNSLTAIMAIDDNPPETVDAIADFSMYLRENLNVLSTNGNIPFEREMEHVMRYADLEILRFGEKLKVEYNIKDEDFEVPPLTVQMLVENSIRHGVTVIREGGKVIISSSFEDGYHVIRVKDNGKGFDTEKVELDDHVGLGSVKKRVCDMGGKFQINSIKGIGTEVDVYIPAVVTMGEEENEDNGSGR